MVEFVTKKPWKNGRIVYLPKERITDKVIKEDNIAPEKIQHLLKWRFITPVPKTRKELSVLRHKKADELKLEQQKKLDEKAKQEAIETKKVAKQKEKEAEEAKKIAEKKEKELKKDNPIKLKKEPAKTKANQVTPEVKQDEVPI